MVQKTRAENIIMHQFSQCNISPSSMDEPFEITVTHQKRTNTFAARLIRYGYTYRIQVSVFGVEIMFEPDEERNYRAVIDPVQQVHVKRDVDKELLKAIAEVLESIVK